MQPVKVIVFVLWQENPNRVVNITARARAVDDSVLEVGAGISW